MTYWAQLLHFYQPPTQTHEVLRRVADESYRPLLAVLKEHPGAKLAINMNGVLTELLEEHGMGDITAGLRELGERGQVEFVGSGKFHPILPLIPQGERVRSIADNARTNRRAFGEAWRPRGFFPPEMCYSSDIMLAIAAAGHDWVRAPANGRNVHVLFRDDVRSNRISFRETDAVHFIEDLARAGAGEDTYVVTAMDAETYGHHIRGWEREFLGAAFEGIAAQQSAPLRDERRRTTRVTMVMPSELPSLFPDGPVIEPLASSWSTTRDDIAARNPYPLWHSPGNRLHDLQWEYVGHCLDLLAIARRYSEREPAQKFLNVAENRLQPALHSCQFWWASRRPMWDVTMVHRGFLLLNEVAINAMKAVTLGAASDVVKREAAWRIAAANEARWQIERLLFMDGTT
ncbi:MAG: hypothetical protein DYG91_08820 [Chloroflexi bacterium CFX7]|nr:hypothetical protein [Chloroflexi bacterium CFX7]